MDARGILSEQPVVVAVGVVGGGDDIQSQQAGTAAATAKPSANVGKHSTRAEAEVIAPATRRAIHQQEKQKHQ